MRREMTPSERLLWERLHAGRLAGLHFRRQQIIEGFIADSFCHAAHLIIKVDGPIHDHQRDYDTERTRILQTYDLRLLRFTNDQVNTDLNSVLTTILLTARQSS